MRSHSDRVGVLTWNSHTLSSGSRDCTIHNHDVRVAEHCVSQYIHHKLEICGLRWSPDGTRLASGGNDNLVCLWNTGSGVVEPQTVLTGHQAAVKVSAFLSLFNCAVCVCFVVSAPTICTVQCRLCRGVLGVQTCWQLEVARTIGASNFGMHLWENA